MVSLVLECPRSKEKLIRRESNYTRDIVSVFVFCQLNFLLVSFCFLFKFNTGTLYTNAMISKFVVEQDPECSRCVGGRLLPAPKETLQHISNILSELNRLISHNTLGLAELANVVWLGVPEKKYTAFSKRP